DRVAQEYGASDGVVWVPGFPPEWWRAALQRLVAAVPAPARIACDPDPAGMQIALEVARALEAVGVPWSPWGMDVQVLESLPAHRPLTDDDRKLLQNLLAGGIPEVFLAVAQWMLDQGLKGEQEGISPSMLRH